MPLTKATPDAQANLAYLYGHEEEFKDYQKAFLYNKLAAAQGDFIAQNNIGVAYEYGEGVKKDLKKHLNITSFLLIKIMMLRKITLVIFINMDTGL